MFFFISQGFTGTVKLVFALFNAFISPLPQWCTHRLGFLVPFYVTLPLEIYLFILLLKMNFQGITSDDCGLGCLRTNRVLKTTQCRFMGPELKKEREPRVHCFYHGGICPLENNKGWEIEKNFWWIQEAEWQYEFSSIQQKGILKTLWCFTWKLKGHNLCIE